MLAPPFVSFLVSFAIRVSFPLYSLFDAFLLFWVGVVNLFVCFLA